MATDYAQSYTASVVSTNLVLCSNLASVNDGNDGSYATVQFIGQTGGGTSTITIDFGGTHNVEELVFRIGCGQYLGPLLKTWYKKNDTWTLMDDLRIPVNTITVYRHSINKKIQSIKLEAGVETTGMVDSVMHIYTMAAIGYDSSGKFRVWSNGSLLSVADTTNLTGQKVRYYDGSTTRALRLMDYTGSPLKIYDDNELKSLAIVE